MNYHVHHTRAVQKPIEDLAWWHHVAMTIEAVTVTSFLLLWIIAGCAAVLAIAFLGLLWDFVRAVVEDRGLWRWLR